MTDWEATLSGGLPEPQRSGLGHKVSVCRRLM